MSSREKEKKEEERRKDRIIFKIILFRPFLKQKIEWHSADSVGLFHNLVPVN